MKKKFFDTIRIAALTGWIPLGIASFYMSDVRVDIKLLIAACISFLGLIIVWVKEG